jgi:hypothetical protein
MAAVTSAIRSGITEEAATGSAAAGAAAAGVLTGAGLAAAGAVGTAVAEVASVAGALEPPPPPQATSVVPNTAIAVIRIAKFWSGRVMASSSRVTVGNKLLPQGILKGYAKAKLHNSKIKVAVHYFVQIQRNVVGSFTTIIRLESDYCVFM